MLWYLIVRNTVLVLLILILVSIRCCRIFWRCISQWGGGKCRSKKVCTNMVGKAKLGERDQLDQIIKLVLHSSEGGSQQLSSARGRAVPVGLGQQQQRKHQQQQQQRQHQQQQQRQSSARRVRALPVGLETSTSSSRWVAFTFLGSLCQSHGCAFNFLLWALPFLCLSLSSFFQWSVFH